MSVLIGPARRDCLPSVGRAAWLFAALLFAASLLSAAANSPAQAAEDPLRPEFDDASLEFFEKQVRPLLARRCYSCHSAKSKEVEGGLRLDSRQAVVAGGDTGPAAVPGQPAKSLLVDAVNYGEVYQMPPKSKLPAAEVAVLTRWVKLGLPWPAEKGPGATAPKKKFDLAGRRARHWAWQPMRNEPPPKVANPGWARRDLDRFILARLEAAGLGPAGEADRATWLRRVTFDLTGLPPTPQQVRAFLADENDGAFERVVDRLLNSPQFGERWARHWMDLARYAETYGHEFDYGIPHAAEYRNYLIRALNADVPYDQFVTEHLAGDLLAEPRLHPTEKYNESVIATGFWWLGEATHAPVDVRGDEANRIDNQIDVMSKSFLGITIACARCHDHKFDAISTKDYYALAGFLQSSRRHEAMLDPGGKIAATAAAMRQTAAQLAPVWKTALPQPNAESSSAFARGLAAGWEAMAVGGNERRVAGIAERYQLAAADVNRWAKALADPIHKDDRDPLLAWRKSVVAGGALRPEALAAYRNQIRDQQRRAEESQKQSKLFVDFKRGNYDGWYVAGEAFGDGPTKGGQWDSASRAFQAVRPGVAHSGRESGKLQGVLRSPTFTLESPQIDYYLNARGVQIRLIVDGYFMDTYNRLLFNGFSLKNVDTKGKVGWVRQGADIRRYQGRRAYIEILDYGDGFAAVEQIWFSPGGQPKLERNPVGRRLFADQEDMKSVAELAAAYGRVWNETLEAWHAGKGDAAGTDLVNWVLKHQLIDASSLDEPLKRAKQELTQYDAQLPRPRRVLAMTDGTPENERVHIRGNHRTLGDVVPRRNLESLGGLDRPAPANGSGRLELARQIVDPENPLTARVAANRVWHQLFGRGIVASVDNFGVLGQRPSHPRLLDHLARQLIRDGWSLKQLIRAIVLSSTYRMSSKQTAAAEKQDPTNRLLHRAPIRRLQAESIRDAVLAVSGRLDRSPFTGTVPVHVTPFMQGRGRPGRGGPLDGSGRRSIYISIRRNFLSPMMLAFDMPIPFNSVGRRNVSNVPAQALILMNDPFVVAQAKVWAERTARGKQPPAERIGEMYLTAFGRPPTDRETSAARDFLVSQGKQYELNPEQSLSDNRTWADLGHVLFNVKEFIYLY